MTDMSNVRAAAADATPTLQSQAAAVGDAELAAFQAWRQQQLAASLQGELSLVPAPTFTSISPASGPLAGGTAFTIYGTGLTPGALVTFGGVSATEIVANGTSITGKTPAGASAVAAGLVITTEGGSAAAPAAFTYQAPAAPAAAVAFGVGEIVVTSSPAGYGLVIASAPVTLPSGAVATGYRVVALGTGNDTLLPADTLGITKL